MPADTLARLSRWYASHCDGDWEHHHGVSIQTCDNPGWWVKINLECTPLADKPFAPIAQNIGDDGRVLIDPNVDGFTPMSRWLNCRIEGGLWHGVGDETRLEEILAIFLDWAEAP